MEMQGSRQLTVTQQQAWDALNDPEVLALCIPGCDKLEALGEGQYAVALGVKIGPVSARFAGKITLSDMRPPASYTIHFDGQGGVAGFGKGSARVVLTPRDVGAELGYTVQAQVGGKVAQLGQRLIDGAARSMAEDFFKRFDAEMRRRHGTDAPSLPVRRDEAPARAPWLIRVPAWVWTAAAFAVIAGVWLLS